MSAVMQRRRPARPVRARAARVAATRRERVTPELLRLRWRVAFDTAEAALRAARPVLPADELHALAHALAAERTPTAQLLRAFAHEHPCGFDRDDHLALPPDRVRQLLGFPPHIRACVFNLNGVLIGSAAIHAQAWAETFDGFLAARCERSGGELVAFDRDRDYAALIHGRPRLDGVRAFLASRGIRLPEGDSDDPQDAETVRGLAGRKNAALAVLLQRRPLKAFGGAREYLELAHDAGLRCGVVSASENATTMLDQAGLSQLVECCLDGVAMARQGLRPRPSADALLAACACLGVTPEQVVAFETAPDGIAAAHAAGVALAVGVGRGDTAQPLRRAGADRVVTGLDGLLDLGRAA
jgi:HAD superfamily hydrolase (TIGR01509 family)